MLWSAETEMGREEKSKKNLENIFSKNEDIHPLRRIFYSNSIKISQSAESQKNEFSKGKNCLHIIQGTDKKRKKLFFSFQKNKENQQKIS